VCTSTEGTFDGGGGNQEYEYGLEDEDEPNVKVRGMLHAVAIVI